MALPPFMENSAGDIADVGARRSLENPSSDDKLSRSTSPARSAKGAPIAVSEAMSALTKIDSPEPDRPAKNAAKPCLARGGLVRRCSVTTSGTENQAGMYSPLRRRQRSSVPEMSRTVMLSSTSLAEIEQVLLLYAKHVFEGDHFHADLGLLLPSFALFQPPNAR